MCEGGVHIVFMESAFVGDILLYACSASESLGSDLV